MNRISVSEFLKLRNCNLPLIDTRSPLEYEQGTIEGSINLPLFNNEEREIIGTIYKQDGKQVAIDKGVEIISRKLVDLKNFIREKILAQEVLTFCWRGGMRSSNMSWFLELLGKKVSVLEGGYKAYRNHVLQYLAEVNLNLVVLGGKTGSGKTKVLRCLHELGEQIIDLEKIADHKGSAFGTIGSVKVVGTEEFENHIFETLQKYDVNRIIWIENESRGVGIAQIPDNLWNQMRNCKVIQIEMDIDRRLHNLIHDYNPEHRSELVNSFEKIRKKLGHENTDRAITLVNEGQFTEAATIALQYYDKTYEYGMSIREKSKIISMPFNTESPMEIAKSLIHKVSNE